MLITFCDVYELTVREKQLRPRKVVSGALLDWCGGFCRFWSYFPVLPTPSADECFRVLLDLAHLPGGIILNMLLPPPAKVSDLFFGL